MIIKLPSRFGLEPLFSILSSKKGIRDTKADDGRLNAMTTFGKHRYLDTYDSGEEQFTLS
jgi:hypothetical protein